MKIIFFLLTYFSINTLANAIDTQKFNTGERIYKETCISCHSLTGNAQTQMKLRVMPRNLRKSVLTQNQTYQIIRDGSYYWGSKAQIMPSFKDLYSEEELRATSYYIAQKFNPNVENRIDTLFKKSKAIAENQKSKMLKRGKKIYKRNCSWCHGLTGKGDGKATKSPIDSIFPYDLSKTLLTPEQKFLYVKYGGKYWGTQADDMPSWSKKYDDYTIKSVIKYIEEVIKEK